MISFLRKHRIEAILWALIAIYTLYFATFSILRYKHLYAEYFDLGIMHQTVYNTYQGLKTFDFSRVLELTDPHGTPYQIKRMAIHNDVILAFLAPFYFIHAGPITLLILQTIVLAAGAWAVFKIAQIVIKHDLIALVFAFAYLLYSPMQRANIFEFHAVTFATTFILFMFYFWLKNKTKLMFLFIVLALLTKEEVGLTLGMFGIYMFSQQMKNKKATSLIPLFITILCGAWAVFSVFVIIPYFNNGAHFAATYYSNVVSNVIPYIFNMSTVVYFIFLLAPLAFLTLFAPEFLLIAAPELAINLLSSDMQLRSLDFHYVSVIQPWIFIGAIYGAKKLIKMDTYLSRFVMVGVLLFSIVLSYFQSPLPYSQTKNIDPWIYGRKEETEVVYKWSKLLDSDSIKVSTTDQIAPLFTSRRYFYSFSRNYFYADYVIVSLPNLQYSYRKDEVVPAYKRLQKDKNFKLVESRNGYEVYKKTQIN